MVPMNCRIPVGNQRGMTFLSFLVTVAVAGLIGKLALTLAPVYLNHYKVIASLESVKANADWSGRSREDLLNSLQKRWEVDSVDEVTTRNVGLTRDAHGTQLRINYDVTRPLFRNIDVVVHFDEFIEAPSR